MAHVRARFGLSESTLRRLIRLGELDAIYFGAAVRITVASLDAYVERHRSRVVA
jgi:excisionase family DNA binding protein